MAPWPFSYAYGLPLTNKESKCKLGIEDLKEKNPSYFYLSLPVTYGVSHLLKAQAHRLLLPHQFCLLQTLVMELTKKMKNQIDLLNRNFQP